MLPACLLFTQVTPAPAARWAPKPTATGTPAASSLGTTPASTTTGTAATARPRRACALRALHTQTKSIDDEDDGVDLASPTSEEQDPSAGNAGSEDGEALLAGKSDDDMPLRSLAAQRFKSASKRQAAAAVMVAAAKASARAAALRQRRAASGVAGARGLDEDADEATSPPPRATKSCRASAVAAAAGYMRLSGSDSADSDTDDGGSDMSAGLLPSAKAVGSQGKRGPRRGTASSWACMRSAILGGGGEPAEAVLPAVATAAQRLPAAEATECLPTVEAAQCWPAAEATECLPTAEAAQRLPAAEATECLPTAEAAQRWPAADQAACRGTPSDGPKDPADGGLEVVGSDTCPKAHGDDEALATEDVRWRVPSAAVEQQGPEQPQAEPTAAASPPAHAEAPPSRELKRRRHARVVEDSDDDEHSAAPGTAVSLRGKKQAVGMERAMEESGEDERDTTPSALVLRGKEAVIATESASPLRHARPSPSDEAVDTRVEPAMLTLADWVASPLPAVAARPAPRSGWKELLESLLPAAAGSGASLWCAGKQDSEREAVFERLKEEMDAEIKAQIYAKMKKVRSSRWPHLGEDKT
eukprot:366130-Chlamydomonas_euryale.AAC.69